jgi:hypothetical protein
MVTLRTSQRAISPLAGRIKVIPALTPLGTGFALSASRCQPKGEQSCISKHETKSRSCRAKPNRPPTFSGFPKSDSRGDFASKRMMVMYTRPATARNSPTKRRPTLSRQRRNIAPRSGGGPLKSHTPLSPTAPAHVGWRICRAPLARRLRRFRRGHRTHEAPTVAAISRLLLERLLAATVLSSSSAARPNLSGDPATQECRPPSRLVTEIPGGFPFPRWTLS